MKKKNPNHYHRPSGRLSLFLIGMLVSIAAAVLLLIRILYGERQTYLAQCTQMQQTECDLLAASLARLAEVSDSLTGTVTRTSEEQLMTDYLSEEAPASGSSWVFLYSDTEVLFAQNSSTTASLHELTDPILFQQQLESEHAVLTTAAIQTDSGTYTVGIITDRSHYLSGTLFAYEVYVILLFAALILLAVGTITGLFSAWSRSERSLRDTSEALLRRNQEFETLSTQSLPSDASGNLVIHHGGKSNRYKQYKFKFYLNARHAIYIDGILGAMHPHTWEITLHVIKMQNNFIQFAELEKKIEAFINRYQDQELNRIPPFDTINPTLENCCDYFKEQLSSLLEQEGWLLLMMEMSETPSRSYVISMIDD